MLLYLLMSAYIHKFHFEYLQTLQICSTITHGEAAGIEHDFVGNHLLREHLIGLSDNTQRSSMSVADTYANAIL